MLSKFSRILIEKLAWVWIGLSLLIVPVYGQSDPELNLKGAIDFHSHQGPDAVDTTLDADDLARLGKKMGMRGMVMKNHWNETAGLAYIVRKEVPGIELIGGITEDGGVNLAEVKHTIAMEGGWGRMVWLTTSDAARLPNDAKGTGKFVHASEDGHLLPSVLELIDFVAQHHEMVLEVDSILPEEGVMIAHVAHERGVTHIVVEHEIASHFRLTVPQMQAAAKDGAFILFLYGQTLRAKEPATISNYAEEIRAIGAKFCVLGTDLVEGPASQRPSGPQGLLDFMVALHKAGISVADINLTAKTNPALVLGLRP
jgi:hypothetical protein